jgi:cytoskeletal protein CcmA (bactofilin family)
VLGVFFKNRVQQDIDSFKGMQEGLRRVGYVTDQFNQVGVTDDSATARESGLESEAKPVNELTSNGSEHAHTIVSGNASWEGNLKTETSARIEGTVRGEIEAGETIFIAKGAKVCANVHARRVIVAGELEGQVSCREQLVVEKSGRLAGSVSTKAIVIAEGAIVQSQIQMLEA